MNRISSFIFLLFFFTLLNAEEVKNFKLIQESDNQYKIDFTVNDIELQAQGEYTRLISKSKGATTDIGMPELPVFTSMIQVKKGDEYAVEYEVKSSRKIKNVKIFPNQMLVDGVERNSVLDIDHNFYSVGSSYPDDKIFLSNSMTMRDIEISILSMVPFNYNPATNELEIYESVEINLIKVKSDNSREYYERPRSRVFEKIYKDEVMNYTSSSRSDDYQMPAILYICGGNSASNSSFQNLVEWRKERGYSVSVVSTSTTGSTSSQIKNYISNAYNNWEIPPEYIALVGDVGGSYSVATHYNSYGHDNYGQDCEGDLPYSQLDGTDLLPEVLVGRISVRSSSEIDVVANKILFYEKATYASSLGNYYERASLAGDTSSSGNSCAITNEYVKESLEEHGFEDVRIKTTGSSWSGWMEDQLEDGVLYFNYRGYLGMSGFSSNNLDNANNGLKLPFATILTCGTGSFAESSETMSEAFLRAGTSTNPKGAVAAVGTATWNTHTLFNNIVNMGMYDGILADNVGTTGAALASGKLALLSTYPGDPYQWVSAFTQWNNLMGDPATHLWTDTPSNIYANHPATISAGVNFIDVYVTDDSNNPISDALVALYVSGNDNPINVYSDSMGQARIQLDDSSISSAKITITKDNHKPYQGDVSTLNESVSLHLDANSNIIVNGSLVSGETLGLSIPIYNYGQSTATGVYASLSSESDYVTINSGSISYGSIPAGQSIYSDDFDITISSAAIQGEDLELFITISDGTGEWVSIVDVNVMGSLLYASSSGDVNPGNTESVTIELTNAGMISATGVIAELSFNGNQIQISDSNGSWINVPSNGNATCTDCFEISVDEDVITGTQFSLQLHIQTSNGYDRVETFILDTGRIGNEDPIGPDTYGYYIYDSYDLDYNLVPTYNWLEIDTNYGGSGTDLNLSNSGNGNWSGNPLGYVDLPFTVKFYGESYDEITVSPNGWIALGYTAMESFRNYPIPGAGGPSPMIAAFWDDLETTNSGDVFIYNAGTSFIIEWSDMRTENNNSLETFQMIIYNDSAPPHGDNSIKIQYKEFNNTSSGGLNDYPPMHGGYATIGIENHLGDDGLQYTFNNTYLPGASDLGDETAIYITTESPVTLPSPDLSYSSSSLDFILSDGNSDEGVVTLSNTGEEGSVLYYSVSQSYDAIDPPFSNPGGGPDAYGYFWSDSNLDGDIDYNWIDISNNSSLLSFNQNDADTDPISIGFEFPFYGENYSEFIVNANGWIGFGQGSSAWYNGNIPSQTDLDGTTAPMPAIFGFWDDLNPVNNDCNSSCGGEIYYQSTSDQLVVWFNNVYHWASEGFENSYYDFQIVINSDGKIDINHQSIEGAYSATVGIQNSTGTIATQVDTYDGNYFQDEVSYSFLKAYSPTNWMSVSSQGGLNGELYNGEFADIIIDVDATDLIEGDYRGNILITTNITSDINFPVNLTVSNEEILLGDINNDGDINVLDVVTLVSSVLDANAEYNPAGDMNSDGELNVLDVVTLVSVILDI